MRAVDSDDIEATPRTIVGIGREYPAHYEIGRHQHGYAQLLYAAEGVVTVDTAQGVWAAPRERAVWIPAETPYALKTVGAASSRNVMIDAAVGTGRSRHCEVLAVSDLLRSLLIAAAEIPIDYDPAGRDGLVMALLIAEISRAETVPFALPFPRTAALARKCQAFIAAPDAKATIDRWAGDLNRDRRAFTRLFRRETGMSFAAWRQQACLLAAFPRLAAGEPVTTIAFDLGYDSPAAFSTMFKRLVGVSPSRYRPDSPL
jgi:AraC-like DNA-binding protein